MIISGHMRGGAVQKGGRAVVMGAGRSGMAAVRLLVRLGAQVRLLEKDAKKIPPSFQAEAKKAGVQIVCGEHGAQHLAGADYIVPSPGIPVANVLMLLSTLPEQEKQPEIMGELELAWRHMHGEPVLAITGTSGKTTTASLAAAMLKSQGYTVFLGGNIGTPLCEYVLANRKADALVVEVSSFQLQTCTTFCPRVATLLNISENHLDYHKDMAEYVDAKLRLFRWQDESHVAIVHTSLKPLENSFKARTIWFDGKEEIFSQTKLLGQHNVSNLQAAWLACREFGVHLDNAAAAVRAFNPLPHRLERVRRHEGVLYVNDSKSTTVTSLTVALQAFTEPVVLLCGGKFKGGDLASLGSLVQSKVRALVLVGDSREHFEKAWKGLVPMSWFAAMSEAVTYAQSLAKSGDVVLLSPATASYDLYTNYEARGDDFKRIVGMLS